jgi:hypothetical protein
MKAHILSALALLLAAGPASADPPWVVERIIMAGGFVGTVKDDAASPVDRVELGADATDADLAGLCELRRLGLCGANVTDEGLGRLGAMGGLRELELFKCPNVTDAGLRHLEAAKGLQLLDLRGCPNVTAEGAARLQRALPGCKIVR